MSLYHAKKLVIITEKLIAKHVCKIIDSHGATGYTVMAAGGKGSRNMRSTPDRASIVEDFANVKIEVIVAEKSTAEAIMEEVNQNYFTNYSGITYLEEVEILRPKKF